ncbi:MAG: ribonuclease HII [Pseudomonadota bacterium]
MIKTPPTLNIENAIPGAVAGVDEAGRGPLAGPVIAAAVILDPNNIPAGLADSKTLTEKRREELAPLIHEMASVGVGAASVSEIDTINILQASLLAMSRAVAALPFAPDACIIDGNQKPKLACRVQTVIKGDAKSLSIAAASIVAKTARDQIMRDLALRFPAYGWEKNKGYGAPAHLTALREHGFCEHHRKSFAPVRALVEAA